jgi:hypothetical protein
MKTRRQMLLRLYDDTQEQIQKLQAISSPPASEAGEGCGSDEPPAYLLAAELKDLTAVVAMLEAELARRGLLRTVN